MKKVILSVMALGLLLGTSCRETTEEKTEDAIEAMGEDIEANAEEAGDAIEAGFMGVDRKNRTLSLSIRAKDEVEEKEAVESVNKQQDSGSGLNSAMAEAFKAAKTDDE